MKKVLIGLLTLGTLSAYASAEIKTAQDNIVRLNVTAIGGEGLDICGREVKSLISKLEKANKVVLKASAQCSEEYKYEHKDGVIARYNGFVEYLKY